MKPKNPTLSEPFPYSLSKDKIRILLLEGISDTAVNVLTSAGYTAIERLPRALDGAELREKLKGVRLLGIRSRTQLTAAAIDGIRSLVAVGCFSVGTNQVDLDACSEMGIPVFNAPFSNTRSVAELTIAEIIMMFRRIFPKNAAAHTGGWDKSAIGSHEIRGKTLGIVGYGHIGAQVGVLAESMGMRVLYFDIATKLPMGNNKSAGTLEELLRQSDFVTLHVPETPQTKELIGGDELARMKDGSYLINLSRGTVVEIEQLAAVLRSGHLSGAAIDVYPEEPEKNGGGFDSPLRGLANVILTPHIGGSTEEAQEAIGVEVATALGKFVTRGTTTRSVNFPEVEQPLVPGKHRLCNVHKNVPGVLGEINKLVAATEANIFAQVLATDSVIGYLVMDIDQDISAELCQRISELPTSISTRVLVGR